MAQSQWINAAATTSTSNVLRYRTLASGNSTTNFTTPETNSASCERELTFSKLRVVMTTNSKTLSNPSVTIRNNGADSAVFISIPFGVTGTYSDTVNTTTVAATNAFSVQFTYGATGSGTVGYSAISVVADYTGAESITVFHNTTITAVSSSTRYHSISGYGVNTSTESQMQVRIPKAGYLKYGVIRITSNTRNGSTVYTLRKNSADTAMVITVPTTTSGVFKDTTNFVSIAANDLVVWKSVLGGTTGTVTPQSMHIEYETSTDEFITVTESAVSYTYTVSVAGTYYAFLGGTSAQALTEAQSKIKFGIADHNANNMRVYVITNARAVISTVTLRKNGADTALMVSIPASTTGHFSNPTNSVPIAVDDDLNLKVYSPAAASGGLAVKRVVVAYSPNLPGSTAIHHAMQLYF
jgi:hypothetical protein